MEEAMVCGRKGRHGCQAVGWVETARLSLCHSLSPQDVPKYSRPVVFGGDSLKYGSSVRT